jgi:D-3-phosphoglycerate dehydrogenase
LPEANASTHAGKWEKSRFMGVELFNKTLGVIGAGNIGGIVCDRALGLKMKVVAYDPFLSEERAKALGVTKVELDDLLARADEIGVAVLSLLDPGVLTASRIAAIACHPSAMLAVITSDAVGDLADRFAAVRNAKGTLLIGMAVDGSRPPPAVTEGADFLVLTLPAAGLPHDGWHSLPTRPLVAWRKADHVTEAGGREACAALQRDLALWGLASGDTQPWDWAGYLVG